MKILLTGASGFLGSHLLNAFKANNDEIITLGRSIKDSINADITSSFELKQSFDLVIHVAGKAHSIPKTENEAAEFFAVNVEGTRNLLNALTTNTPGQFVFISSVAVYGKEEGENINEDYALDGNTPYAKSKIEAEKIVQAWTEENHVNSLVLRLPLISGTNPPGNLGAMAKAISKGYYFRIGDGLSRRSMIAATDVATFILTALGSSGIYNLTDDKHPTIADTDATIARMFNKPVRKLPVALLKPVALAFGVIPGFPLNLARLNKLTATLTFSNSAAKKLGWKPKPALKQLSFTNQ